MGFWQRPNTHAERRRVNARRLVLAGVMLAAVAAGTLTVVPPARRAALQAMGQVLVVQQPLRHADAVVIPLDAGQRESWRRPIWCTTA